MPKNKKTQIQSTDSYTVEILDWDLDYGINFGPIRFKLDLDAESYLKRYEDALDALVCAWVGVKFLEGETQPLGDETAAIWCPRDVV
ncbi:MAG: hypothetical protein SCH71_15885 [Desulfobulbaceae bacterium]|nr:hypothetical protein [Desulfobulbaceae bacterium]